MGEDSMPQRDQMGQSGTDNMLLLWKIKGTSYAKVEWLYRNRYPSGLPQERKINFSLRVEDQLFLLYAFIKGKHTKHFVVIKALITQRPKVV